MTGAALAILATLRARGAAVRLGTADRIGIAPPTVLDDDLRAGIRAHRVELVRLLAAERAAAQWRAHFELLAAERQHVDGDDRDRARSWAYYQTLCEWTDQHEDVAVLASALAEPLARHALAELGIFEPQATGAATPFCSGCGEAIPFGRLCFACDLGMTRCAESPLRVRIALDLRDQLGSAGGRGVRMNAIEAEFQRRKAERKAERLRRAAARRREPRP